MNQTQRRSPARPTAPPRPAGVWQTDGRGEPADDFPANGRRRTCRGHHKGGVGLSRFDAGSRCASTATPGFWHAAVCFRRAILRGRRRANRPGLGDTAGSRARRALRLASCAGRMLVGAPGRGNRTRDLTKYPSRRQDTHRRRGLGCLLVMMTRLADRQRSLRRSRAKAITAIESRARVSVTGKFLRERLPLARRGLTESGRDSRGGPAARHWTARTVTGSMKAAGR